jgi:hypothetical protein
LGLDTPTGVGTIVHGIAAAAQYAFEVLGAACRAPHVHRFLSAHDQYLNTLIALQAFELIDRH